MTEIYGLGTMRTLQSFEQRVGVDFRTSTESPHARNAGRPSADFNDSIAAGLEGVLGILSKAGMGGGTTGGSGAGNTSATGDSSVRPVVDAVKRCVS